MGARAHLGGRDCGDILVCQFLEDGCLPSVVQPEQQDAQLLAGATFQLAKDREQTLSMVRMCPPQQPQITLDTMFFGRLLQIHTECTSSRSILAAYVRRCK
jgi:hypothetical protein